MGRKTSIINLTAEAREYLEIQTRARTIQAQTVSRVRILLLKADGWSVDDIADKIVINRKSVMLCLNKYAEGGVENALFDAQGRGCNAEITDDEKDWIISIACQKTIDVGYATETWNYAKLTSHINKNAEASGYTRLSNIHKSTVHSILDEAQIKSFWNKYTVKIGSIILIARTISNFWKYSITSIQRVTRILVEDGWRFFQQNAQKDAQGNTCQVKGRTGASYLFVYWWDQRTASGISVEAQHWW